MSSLLTYKESLCTCSSSLDDVKDSSSLFVDEWLTKRLSKSIINWDTDCFTVREGEDIKLIMGKRNEDTSLRVHATPATIFPTRERPFKKLIEKYPRHLSLGHG